LPVELNGTIRGTDYDAINVDGLLILSGSLDVILYEYEPGKFYNPQLGEQFDVMNWGSLSGTFVDGINLPGLDPGLDWDVSTLYDDGTIRVVPVPEPGTFVLFFVGLLSCGLAGSRRKQH